MLLFRVIKDKFVEEINSLENDVKEIYFIRLLILFFVWFLEFCEVIKMRINLC